MEEQQAVPAAEPQVDAISAPEEQLPQTDQETEVQTESQTQVEEPQTQELSQSEASEPLPQAQAPEIEEEEYIPTEVPELQPFDISQYAQEDGTLDVNAVNQGIGQAVQQAIQISTSQMRLEMEEKNEWDKAINAYPELKSDTNLRNMVHQLRAGSVLENNGKGYLSPKQAADRLMKIRGAAVQEGVKQAQTHTRVQESAVLETSDTTADPGATRRMQAKQQLNSNNYKERQAAKDMLLKDVAGKLLEQQFNQR